MRFAAHDLGRYLDWYEVRGEGIVDANVSSIEYVEYHSRGDTVTLTALVEDPTNRITVKLY
jgi:hypothetical protein